MSVKVLIACEESQRVCTAFREHGIEAYSCDIQECSGGHPEWHIMGDCLPLLNGRCEFYTMDGTRHYIGRRWDMIIAHPPCTHIATSGARHFEKKRADGRQREGIEFFCRFLIADCDLIVIENPVGIISGDYVAIHFPDLAEKYGLPIKPSQIIQPYEHGDPFRKATCLWFVGKVKPLVPGNIVEPVLKEYISKSGVKYVFSIDYGSGDSESGKRRSKTYPGIAKAMAEQWTPILLNNTRKDGIE